MAIADKIAAIRNAIFGKDVRKAIADGIEECYSDVSNAKTIAADAATRANNAAQTALNSATTANQYAQEAHTAAEEVNGIVNDLKDTIDKNFKEDYVRIPFEILSNPVSAVDGSIGSSSSSSHTDYIDITMFSSIKYKRRGTVNSSSTAGLAFYDSTKTFIPDSGIRDATSQAQTGYLSELHLVTPPSGAVYVMFTTFTNTDTYGYFEAHGLSHIADDVIQTKDALQNTNGVLQMSDSTEIKWFKETDCGIKYADGDEIYSSVFSATNYIDIRAFKSITYKQLVLSTTTINTGIAFYDASKTFITGSGIASISGSTTGEVRDNTVDVPEGACFVRCTMFRNDEGREFSISGQSKLSEINDVLQDVKADSDMSDAWIKGEKEISVQVKMTSGYAVSVLDGELVPSSVYESTNYIDVRAYKRIKYTRIKLRSGATVNTGLALYDSDKNFMYGISSAPILPEGSEGEYFYEYVSIDPTVSYIRATAFMNPERGQFELFADTSNIDHRYDVEIEPTCPFAQKGRVNVKTGNIGSSTVLVVTGFLSCHDFDFVKYTRVYLNSDSINYGMAFYDENENFIYAGQMVGRTDGERFTKEEKVAIPDSAYYVRFTYYDQDFIESYYLPRFNVVLIKSGTIGDRIRQIDGKGESVTGLYPYKPKSEGVANVIKRAHQLANLKWTPIGDVTREMMHLDGTIDGVARYKAGVEYVGVPYSPSRGHKNTVGIELPVDQFVSIVRNPKTRIYDPDLNARFPYYGIVCSSFVFASLGIKAGPITKVMPYVTEIVKVAEAGTFDEYSLELGSIFLYPNDHAALVTGILVDENGVIKYIEISEATTTGYLQGGRALSKWWEPRKIFERFAEFDLYEYPKINEVKYFGSNNSQVEPEKACYIDSDRDCYPVWGDDCRLWINDTTMVEIAISDEAYGKGYRTLNVFKDGEAFNTYAIESSTDIVEVPRPEMGKYRAFLAKTNGEMSKPIRWVVYGGTLSKVVNGTTLTLTYNTPYTIFGIDYNYDGDRYFTMCDPVTGEGTKSFSIREGATSFEVILGEDEHAIHRSI